MTEKIITPSSSGDFEILKVTEKDGTIMFLEPVAKYEIKTEETDYYLHAHQWLDWFQALTNLLDDDDYSVFGFMLETLVRDAKKELDEFQSFLEEYLDSINIIVIARGNDPYRPGRVVGLSVKPEKEVSAS